MGSKKEHGKRITLGDDSWIELLSRCIDTIDSENFNVSLLTALRSITDFDYSVSFAYHRNEPPICLHHTFNPAQRVIFVDDYLKGPYLLDPFSQACGHGVDNGLYRLRDIAPDRFLQSEYYRSYYVRTGLAEEICYIFYLPGEVAVAISLMRDGENSRFSAREFRMLESVSPLVISLAQCHWQNSADWFETGQNLAGRADNQSIIEDAIETLFKIEQHEGNKSNLARNLIKLITNMFFFQF